MESKLTEVGALALERFYIRWYGRKDQGTGILRNMTDGGEGTSGYTLPKSLEHRKKMSLAKLGKTPSCTYTRRSYIGSNNPRSKKCLSPTGITYACALDAANDLNMCVKSIQYRCRKNTMGWSYI